MNDIQLNAGEIVAAMGELFKVNPLAEQQFHNIILRQRLAAAEARIAALTSPDGTLAKAPVPAA